MTDRDPDSPPADPPMDPAIDPPIDPIDAARRQRVRGFLNHLIAYFAVMVVLVPINALLDPGTPWFALPLVAWGAPLAIHAAYAMGLIGKKPQGEER